MSTRIPILFPENLRAHLFLVKINSEAGSALAKRARQSQEPTERPEPAAPVEKPPGTRGVPSSPLND